MVRTLVFSFFFLLRGVYAIEIPQEENLYKNILESGVATWIRENNIPSHMASVRVVWSKEGNPVSYSLDCPASDVEDLSLFFEYCKEKMEGSFERAAVIAVGDFSKDDMGSFIANHFDSLAHMPQDLSVRPISIQYLSNRQDSEVSLAYPAAIEMVQNMEDFKKLWCLYFFQGLVQKRFEQSLKESKGQWIGGQERRFLLPQRVCIAKASCMTEASLDVLMGFLLAIQEIRKAGFKEQEFLELKSKVQKHLLGVNHKIPASGILASYYADLFVFDRGSPAYVFFVHNSLNLLQDLSLRDVHELVGAFLTDERRLVELVVPMGYDLQEGQVEEALEIVKANTFILDLSQGALTDGPVPINGPNPYALLPISKDDAETIWKIIDTVANNNPIKLAFKKNDLERKGQKVNHVHPLKFLGTIFSDPHLKACMTEIEDSYFKWNGFIGGLAGRMNEEYTRNNLLPYIQGFCQAVKANPEKVREYVLKRDWEGLVRYLL